MATSLTRKRTYHLTPAMLMGVCQAALVRIRAEIEQQDLARGALVAIVGGGMLGPAGELALQIDPLEGDRAHLTVTWHARALGGDRTILTNFLAAVEALAHRA